ncbi:unnamed protein product, partial [Prorocentrum cordatum]
VYNVHIVVHHGSLDRDYVDEKNTGAPQKVELLLRLVGEQERKVEHYDLVWPPAVENPAKKQRITDGLDEDLWRRLDRAAAWGDEAAGS